MRCIGWGRSLRPTGGPSTRAARHILFVLLLIGAVILLLSATAAAAPPEGRGAPEHVRGSEASPGPPAHAPAHGAQENRAEAAAPAPPPAESAPQPAPAPSEPAPAPITPAPTPGPILQEPAPAPAPAPSDPISSEPISSEPISSEPISSEPISSEPISSEPISSEPISSDPVSSDPIASDPHAQPTPAPAAASPEPALDPSLEFTYWAEDRLLFVLAFSLERDDHEHARYLWEWGDGTTTHGDALASHDYRTDGDRFLVKVTRLVDGVATHTSEAWVLLDDWLWATDDDPLQPRGAQTTNGATTPPGRQDAPHAAPAERIVLEAREQRIVYEAPAVVLPGILLVLTAITLGRRRFPR